MHQPPSLSKRARTLLRRLYDGKWYSAVDYAPGPAMQELIDAGCVIAIGRVQKIARCYVPRGTRPDYDFPSKLPKRPKWL